jgi:hypothetical protein
VKLKSLNRSLTASESRPSARYSATRHPFERPFPFTGGRKADSPHTDLDAMRRHRQAHSIRRRGRTHVQPQIRRDGCSPLYRLSSKSSGLTAPYGRAAVCARVALPQRADLVEVQHSRPVT